MSEAFFCHVRPHNADIASRPRLTPTPEIAQSDDSYAERKRAAIRKAEEIRARRPSMQVKRLTPWIEWCAL